MLLLTIPVTVVLSTCICVGGCGYPSSSRLKRSTLASLEFIKRAPSLASAAEAATIFKTQHVTWMGLLRKIGLFTNEKAWLRAHDAVKYEALECTFKIISEA